MLASKYDIIDWLETAYFALCVRPSPLTTEEATQLGTTATVIIAKIREEAIRREIGAARRGSPAAVQNANIIYILNMVKAAVYPRSFPLST